MASEKLREGVIICLHDVVEAPCQAHELEEFGKVQRTNRYVAERSEPLAQRRHLGEKPVLQEGPNPVRWGKQSGQHACVGGWRVRGRGDGLGEARPGGGNGVEMGRGGHALKLVPSEVDPVRFCAQRIKAEVIHGEENDVGEPPRVHYCAKKAWTASQTRWVAASVICG